MWLWQFGRFLFTFNSEEFLKLIRGEFLYNFIFNIWAPLCPLFRQIFNCKRIVFHICSGPKLSTVQQYIIPFFFWSDLFKPSNHDVLKQTQLQTVWSGLRRKRSYGLLLSTATVRELLVRWCTSLQNRSSTAILCSGELWKLWHVK